MRFEYPPPGYVDRASWWFAGYVCGLLFAAAFAMLSGGCWMEAQRCAPVDPIIVHDIRPADLSCAKLRTVGKVPPDPDFKACTDGPTDDYFYCRAVELQRYSDALHTWIGNAIAECSP